jgi:arginyl-tRNA synthetase
VPEDGYQGDYVAARGAAGTRLDGPGRGRPRRRGGDGGGRCRPRCRVRRGDFDHWAYESALHEGDPSPVERTLAILEEQGHAYRSEGALWLRTTDFGDDKDRVLVRSNGEHTYFASDIAYHQDKRERGFDRQIDVWGADHHGYVRA